MNARSLMRRTGATPRREDVFFPMNSLLNQFYEEFFNTNPLGKVGNLTGFPKLDAYEDGGEFVIRAVVAGMTEDNLRIEVDSDNVLCIAGTVNEEHVTPKVVDALYMRELRSSSFERRLQLPDGVEGDPTAALKDGVLTLRWTLKGKEPPQKTVKQIPINVKKDST